MHRVSAGIFRNLSRNVYIYTFKMSLRIIMYQRSIISFHADKETLSGWFYQPHSEKLPAPCIIMTHGFSALIDHHLAPFAETFAAAGFCVLVYDHRNCGLSSGEPRHEINPELQIKDYSHAINFVQTLPMVKADCIGIWGTSYSGGHVLIVGANDRRVKSIVSQVPYIKGHHAYLKQKYPEKWLSISQSYEIDRINRANGKTPQTIPVVSLNKNNNAIMVDNRAYDFFTSVKQWQNEVTLQSIAMSGEYCPGNWANKISPTPILYIIAEHDRINPTAFALECYEQTLQPKKLIQLKGDHFSAYLEEFTTASHAACEWYKNTLF